MTAVSPGARPTNTTPLYLGGFILLGSTTLLIGPSLEVFRNGAHVSKSRIGLLFTAAAVGYLVGSIITGQLLKRTKVHTVLSAGLLISAAAIAALSSVHIFWALVFLQALNGFGGALVDVTGNAAVLWIHKGGPVMNALHLCFGIGATLAPLLVSRSLAWTNSLRAAYLFLAAILAVLAVALLLRQGPANPHSAEAKGVPSGKGLLLAIGALFFVFYVGVEFGFAGWIFDYGVARGLDRRTTATWLGTAFLAMFTFGRVLSIPLAKRFTPWQVLLGDCGVCCVALVILLIGRDSVIALWTGTIGFGLGAASMFPSMLSFAEPAIESTSTVTSAFLGGASIGSMIIPVAIGNLLDKSGPTAMPIVVLAGTIACGITIVAFRRESTKFPAARIAM